MPDVSGRHGGSPNTRTEEIPACLRQWTRTSKEVAAEARTHAGLGDRLRFPPYASAVPDAGVAWVTRDARRSTGAIGPRSSIRGPSAQKATTNRLVSAGVPNGREHRPVEVRDIAAGDSGEHESGCEFAAQGMRRTAWCLVDDRCTTPTGELGLMGVSKVRRGVRLSVNQSDAVLMRFCSSRRSRWERSVPFRSSPCLPCTGFGGMPWATVYRACAGGWRADHRT